MDRKEKIICQFCQFCQFRGSLISPPIKQIEQNTMETDKTDNTDRANFYDKEETGRRYFLFVCPKLPKMNQKFCYLSQRTQRKQNCTYIKNARETMGLWDFKVS